MTTTAIKIMTPAQFLVARALAASFGHLWAGVPDGTYAIDDIDAWLDEEEAGSLLPASIGAPRLNEEGKVEHTTGTGRLRWTVNTVGSVALEVYRPGDICVARCYVVSLEEREDVCHFADDENAPEFNFSASEHDETLRDDLLFQRHVAALGQPIEALLRLTMDEARAKNIVDSVLAPLYVKALPDPFYNGYEPCNEEELAHVQERYRVSIPETFWWIQESYSYEDARKWYTVSHRFETFPVESDKTAVHTVLLLKDRPEMSLIEAVKAAIVSGTYRPGYVEGPKSHRF